MYHLSIRIHLAMSRLTRIITVIIVIAVPVVVIAYVASIYLGNSDQDDGSKGSRVTPSLKFVVAVARHGNRAPLYPLQNFPYSVNNKTYWPYGPSGLSKVGRLEMYKVGAKLRSMYNGFLSPEYYSYEFFATSTSVDRVLISGEALMAGLYPPEGFQKWDSNISWQPVPLHMDSLDKTEMSNGCKRFTTEQALVKAAIHAKYNDSINYITGLVSNETQSTVSGTFGLVSIWDALYSIDTEGYELPDWTRKIYPEAMRDMMTEMYNVYVADNDELVKLVIGPFYEVMLEAMRAKVNGTLSPDRKFYFYSGHDDSLITLQAALGLNMTQIIGIVAPASTMVYELHQDQSSGNYTMQVLYINGTDSVLKPFPLETPLCGNPCDFNLLVQNTQKFYVPDYQAECNTSRPSS